MLGLLPPPGENKKEIKERNHGLHVGHLALERNHTSVIGRCAACRTQRVASGVNNNNK